MSYTYNLLDYFANGMSFDKLKGETGGTITFKNGTFTAEWSGAEGALTTILSSHTPDATPFYLFYDNSSDYSSAGLISHLDGQNVTSVNTDTFIYIEFSTIPTKSTIDGLISSYVEPTTLKDKVIKVSGTEVARYKSAPTPTMDVSGLVCSNTGQFNYVSTYTTGTASQSGTTITGSGTTFTSAMVGGTIVFKSGEKNFIRSFVSATSLTVVDSATVGSGTYTIYYGGNTQYNAQSAVKNLTVGGQIFNSAGTAGTAGQLLRFTAGNFESAISNTNAIQFKFTADYASAFKHSTVYSFLPSTNYTMYQVSDGLNNTSSPPDDFSISSATGGRGLLYTGPERMAMLNFTGNIGGTFNINNFFCFSAASSNTGTLQVDDNVMKVFQYYYLYFAMNMQAYIMLKPNYKYTFAFYNSDPSWAGATYTVKLGSIFSILLL